MNHLSNASAPPVSRSLIGIRFLGLCFILALILGAGSCFADILSPSPISSFLHITTSTFPTWLLAGMLVSWFAPESTNSISNTTDEARSAIGKEDGIFVQENSTAIGVITTVKINSPVFEVRDSIVKVLSTILTLMGAITIYFIIVLAYPTATTSQNLTPLSDAPRWYIITAAAGVIVGIAVSVLRSKTPIWSSLAAAACAILLLFEPALLRLNLYSPVGDKLPEIFIGIAITIVLAYFARRYYRLLITIPVCIIGLPLAYFLIINALVLLTNMSKTL